MQHDKIEESSYTHCLLRLIYSRENLRLEWSSLKQRVARANASFSIMFSKMFNCSISVFKNKFIILIL